MVMDEKQHGTARIVAQRQPFSDGIWIGLAADFDTPQYSWVDGKRIKLNKWRAGEPTIHKTEVANKYQVCESEDQNERILIDLAVGQIDSKFELTAKECSLRAFEHANCSSIFFFSENSAENFTDNFCKCLPRGFNLAENQIFRAGADCNFTENIIISEENVLTNATQNNATQQIIANISSEKNQEIQSNSANDTSNFTDGRRLDDNTTETSENSEDFENVQEISQTSSITESVGDAVTENTEVEGQIQKNNSNQSETNKNTNICNETAPCEAGVGCPPLFGELCCESRPAAAICDEKDNICKCVAATTEIISNSEINSIVVDDAVQENVISEEIIISAPRFPLPNVIAYELDQCAVLGSREFSNFVKFSKLKKL